MSDLEMVRLKEARERRENAEAQLRELQEKQRRQFADLTDEERLARYEQRMTMTNLFLSKAPQLNDEIANGAVATACAIEQAVWHSVQAPEE